MENFIQTRIFDPEMDHNNFSPAARQTSITHAAFFREIRSSRFLPGSGRRAQTGPAKYLFLRQSGGVAAASTTAGLTEST
jgi:hypothetical protein